MINCNYTKFEPYTAFRLLVLLYIVKKGKYILDLRNSDKFGTFLINSIKEDLITFSAGNLKTNNKLEFVAIDELVLKNYMINFIINYGFNYNILKDDFLKNFDKSEAPKFYPITDYKYVPYVLLEYAKNENFVRDLRVSINDNFIFSLKHSYSINDLLPFEIIVDISYLLDDIVIDSKNAKNSKKIKTEKYSKLEQKIYDFIRNEVNFTDIYIIDYYTLRNFIKKHTKYIYKAIYSVNKKYKKINKTDEVLIRYDKISKEYRVNRAIS
jgi:hypothetical protein